MSEEALHLEIITPEKSYFSGDVESVTLPGKVGRFTILPHHAPIVSSLVEGVITYSLAASEDKEVQISGGFVEMSNNQVTVCAEI